MSIIIAQLYTLAQIMFVILGICVCVKFCKTTKAALWAMPAALLIVGGLEVMKQIAIAV